MSGLTEGTGDPRYARQVRRPSSEKEHLVKEYEAVTRLAEGRRSDYACDRFPIPGGQADVFKARHKPTGTVVALKKLRTPRSMRVARMAREIEIGRMLQGHPHAMPILDACHGHTWFVMPYAEQTAEGMHRELQEDPRALLALITAVCSVLADAHREGWVHRDIKPSNILRLDGRWVLADWGIARRPRGQTSDRRLTRVGVSMGSKGFAAPELSDDAHSAGPQADIYSLGQVIGWVVTGQYPRANRALIPESGPFRTIVRAATREDPGKRPTGIDEFLALIARDIEPSSTSPVVQAVSLRRELAHGSPTAAERLIALAYAHIDDAALYCDVLAGLDEEKLFPALLADIDRAIEVVRAMATLLGSTRRPERSEVDATILWLFTIARRAAEVRVMPLLEECLDLMFELDAEWDQGFAQERIRPWLRGVSGEVASSAADALSSHTESAAHFMDLATDMRVDRRVRASLMAARRRSSVVVPGPRADRTALGSVVGAASPHAADGRFPDFDGLPQDVAVRLVTTLYRKADELHWHLLGSAARAKQIDLWCADPAVGGVLRRYVPDRPARVWIKDVPMRLLAQAHEGLGPFASFVPRAYRGAEEIVEAAFGAGFSVVPGSVAQKPLRCYASNGVSDGFAVWGPAKSLRDLLWSALNEAAAVPGDPASPVVVVTSDYGEPVRAEDRARQQRLAEHSGVRLLHLRRKMVRRSPPHV
ncbi:serine/threonine-protein kinase [Streptomyces coeruleorubidus]|uniref:serine/threonine-protein kinase n=1 Tax=Streptomyces coeruleorubidus TaxID=116188 RepID=UPI003682769F